MAERRATLMEPRMEDLLERVGSKFTLVVLAAKRAREINDYYNQLGEGLGKIEARPIEPAASPPAADAVSEAEAGDPAAE
jgi:DNA-directed RNA polymerase subunit omega